jgi:hypothetical protein
VLSSTGKDATIDLFSDQIAIVVGQQPQRKNDPSEYIGVPQVGQHSI